MEDTAASRARLPRSQLDLRCVRRESAFTVTHLKQRGAFDRFLVAYRGALGEGAVFLWMPRRNRFTLALRISKVIAEGHSSEIEGSSRDSYLA